MMKYLLPFLETLPDGPNLTDPEFQQLLVDVQAGKTQARSTEAFEESLEKVVHELKSTPESLHFQRPVAKRDVPDYYEVIKKPMDLSTILRNIKSHRYKNKAEFAAEINLIWENCFTYNTHESHPIRMQARFMKQKADHHLEFLADRAERGAAQLLSLPLPAESSTSSRPVSVGPSGSNTHAPVQPSPLRGASRAIGADEDAAGESDDGGGGTVIVDNSFRDEAGAGPQTQTAANPQETTESSTDGSRGRSASQTGREASVVSTTTRAGGRKPNGIRRSVSRHKHAVTDFEPAPFRPKLQTSLEGAPALIRTSESMIHYLPLSLNTPGPSTFDKDKAKEMLHNVPPPSWFPGDPLVEDEELRLEGSWWGLMSRDEAYTSGLPSIPTMAAPTPPRRLRIGSKRQRSSPSPIETTEPKTPPLDPPRPVKLENVMHRSVDKLFEARKVMGQINEWQRIEADGGILLSLKMLEVEEKERAREEQTERKRRRNLEFEEARKKRKEGGEVGDREAAFVMKKATASVLAHSGFEGANEIALDLLTRVAVDHIRSVGRTFRLFLDGYSQKLSSEELVLHALHENGEIQTQNLEAHIKDDIEREQAKISEMARKVRQAYKEVATAPVIEDDMMFNENGEMLLDGNFAEELGEDFLGLREMGIDKEFGLSSLSVPSSLFYGRRRRAANADSLSAKEELPDYPPPPSFIPLNASTISTHLPALFHGFFDQRIESGRGLADDVVFDPARSQIGTLGQIVVKNPPGTATAIKKKRESEEAKKEEKKAKTKKVVQPGVGKGNWVRPPKEERDRRAAEKRAFLEQQRAAATGPGGPAPNAGVVLVSGSEDAEGEEE